ncbi:hypothetical protein LX36DRAFT_678478 [Colletotrichum falcatum]|nr:hypothetical protein LX36DRAFT_678478 [Colletotrichum falcatum]
MTFEIQVGNQDESMLEILAQRFWVAVILAYRFHVSGLDGREFDYGLTQEADHGQFHFHSAGLVRPGAYDDWAYAAITLTVIPLMREKKSGVIVNIASMAERSGAEAGIAYTTTRNVTWRSPKKVIRYNAVLPGCVDSRMGGTIVVCHQDEYGTEAQAEPAHALHVQALDEVFLATDQAKTVNEASLLVDQAKHILHVEL